jgi:hypothetical protein
MRSFWFPLLLAVALPALARADAQRFATPEEAARALVEAARADDEAALRGLVGEEQAELVLESGDPAVAERRKRFAEGADARLELRREGDDRAILVVGPDAYAFPLPLVHSEAGWAFDAEEGAEEIVDRTVGQNELAAISVLHDYVTAQRSYAAEPHDGTPVRRFATRFLSTPGKRDGLYWETGEGEEPSPFGPLSDGRAAPAERAESYYGYHYRVLTKQGAAAPGGAYSYVINGNLVAGFAAIAWPAEYGRTGVKTFLVNHYGVVYEKDLGEKTGRAAASITAYAPDATWDEVD